MKRRKVLSFCAISCVVSALLTGCRASPALDIDIWAEKSGLRDDNRIVNATNFNATDSRQGKVLNFFPIPVEEECNANDRRRKGVCMNTYECRMQGGTSFGACALGFGVCCVFTATCDQDVYNNITYFINPDFPDLSRGVTTCTLKMKKIDPEIAQFRLDFIHFHLGQPNRRNGVCEEDFFMMTGGNAKELVMCGINSGQHVYYDVDNVDEAISISMNLSKKAIGRLWEVKITQIPFIHRAPAGCLQYNTGMKGVIKTLNFADNGRILANQDYNICMRQEEGMCSIAYEPCDANSFRIGNQNPQVLNSMPSQSPAGGNPAQSGAAGTMSDATMGAQPSGAQNDATGTMDAMDPQDVGSGDGAAADVQSRMMEICTDRITLPCDSEELLMPVDSGMGFCTLAHCGSSLCPMGETPCRVESSVTPFAIGVHFGPTARDESPEDNLGMCLTYEQQPCMV